MTYAAIYTRVADESSDPTGHERQLDACLAYVEREGLLVVEALRDTGSAYGPRRGFARLVEIVADGDVEEVVVWNVDRLARRYSDLALLRGSTIIEVAR